MVSSHPFRVLSENKVFLKIHQKNLKEKVQFYFTQNLVLCSAAAPWEILEFHLPYMLCLTPPPPSKTKIKQLMMPA